MVCLCDGLSCRVLRGLSRAARDQLGEGLLRGLGGLLRALGDRLLCAELLLCSARGRFGCSCLGLGRPELAG